MLRRVVFRLCTALLVLIPCAPAVFTFRAVFFHFGNWTVSLVNAGPTIVGHPWPLTGWELGVFESDKLLDYIVPTIDLTGPLPCVTITWPVLFLAAVTLTVIVWRWAFPPEPGEGFPIASDPTVKPPPPASTPAR
jgi:hypothetical protein